MPAIMTLGGIALAVLGILIAFAGMPDRAAGLGLGSDLIQTGASVFAGGLVVAALGQVLKALKDVADRVEEAGFLSGPRQSLNDELSENAPMPLPRAAARKPAAALPEDEADTPAAPPAREPRTPPQPAPRGARTATEASRPLARGQARPAPQPEPDYEVKQDDDFADDYPAGEQTPRPEPRWMRAQAEANNRPHVGVIPMQSSRATPVAPPRREAAQAQSYDADPRRRAPQPEAIEDAEPTVVRSGIIAGMAYTLYSDRSIEAELPSGTVRFNSLAELQEHVKRAGVEEHDEYARQNGAQH